MVHKIIAYNILKNVHQEFLLATELKNVEYSTRNTHLTPYVII